MQVYVDKIEHELDTIVIEAEEVQTCQEANQLQLTYTKKRTETCRRPALITYGYAKYHET